MTEAEALGRIKMGVNVDIKRSDGKRTNVNKGLSNHISNSSAIPIVSIEY